VLERGTQLAPHPVEEPQEKVAARVIRLELEGARELALRVAEDAGPELNQAQVRMKDRGVRLLLEQSACCPGRSGKIAAPELDDRDEVQKVFVLGAPGPRELELLPGLLETSGLEVLARSPQMKKKDRLVERGAPRLSGFRLRRLRCERQSRAFWKAPGNPGIFDFRSHRARSERLRTVIRHDGR